MEPNGVKKQVEGILQQACVLISRREYVKASSLLEPHAKKFAQLGAEGFLFPILGNLGICYYELGRLTEARSCFERVLDIARKLGQPKGVADTLQELSMVLRKQGEFEQAISKCQEALDIYVRHGSEGTDALQKLSILYTDKHQYERAKEALEIVKESYEAHNNLRGLAHALNQLAIVSIHLRRITEAASYFYKSIRIKKQIGDTHGIETTLQNVRALLRSNPQAIPDPTVQKIITDIARETGKRVAWFVFTDLKQLGEAVSDFYKSIQNKKQMGDTHGVETALQELRILLRSNPEAIRDPTVQRIVRDIAREINKPFAW